MPTALVVGATGGVGHAVARALVARGWSVVALARNSDVAARRFPDLAVRWVTGDAGRALDVVAAAAGAAVIIHAASPPKYRRWREVAIPMLAASIAAAEATGARIIFPGNVYIYGADAGTVVAEGAPAHPPTEKGRVRLEMEEMLRTAASRPAGSEPAAAGAADPAAAAPARVRSVVVRAGDFFGADVPASWVTTAMVTPGTPLSAVTYPGDDLNVGHGFAYIPDLAATIAELADREAELPDFDTFHFGGHHVARAFEFADALRRAAGRPAAPIKQMPWTMVWLLQPVVPLFREIYDMRYLWQADLRLDNSKLVAFLGHPEPHTPLDEALRATVTGLRIAAGPPTSST